MSAFLPDNSNSQTLRQLIDFDSLISWGDIRDSLNVMTHETDWNEHELIRSQVFCYAEIFARIE